MSQFIYEDIFQPFLLTTMKLFSLSLSGDRCFSYLQEGSVPALWAYLFQVRWTKWNDKTKNKVILKCKSRMKQKPQKAHV